MLHFCNDPRGRRRIQHGVRDARVLFNFFAKETDERERERETGREERERARGARNGISRLMEVYGEREGERERERELVTSDSREFLR